MKTNSKQQNRSYALGILLLLMTIIMVGFILTPLILIKVQKKSRFIG